MSDGQGRGVEVPLPHLPLQGGDDLHGCVEDAQLRLGLVVVPVDVLAPAEKCIAFADEKGWEMSFKISYLNVK